MTMKAVLFACAFIAATVSTLRIDEWESFKRQFGKTYESPAEEAKRKANFADNLAQIHSNNELYEKGQVTFLMGINHLADMTSEEIAATLNGYRSPKKSRSIGSPLELDSETPVPDSIDWRNYGYVTPVKNQGNYCGSCWSFSTTGSIEGQHAKVTGNLVSLSEQNLMDCCVPYGELGCHGGSMDPAFKYVINNGGIDTEESYPYETRIDKCRYNATNSGAQISSFVDVESGNETALKDAVGGVGPVSVAIDARWLSFHFYSSGIYYEPKCSSTKLDHAVLAVGYGSENGQDYWLVKNSWGVDWGEQGYIMMSRNRDNNCGIATNASYPVV